MDGIPINPHQVRNSDTNLAKVIDALASRKSISFDYRAADNNDGNRALEPYGVGTKNGFWYVAGNDLERRAVRLFRLDRVVSEVKEQGRGSSYEIPENFSMHEQLQARTRKHVAQLLVRKGKAHQLRKYAQVNNSQDEWDQLQYHYSDVKELLRDLLWHRDDVKVIGPTEIQDSLLAALSSIRVRHE